MSPKRDDVHDNEPWIRHFEISCFEDDFSIEEMRRMTLGVSQDDMKDLKGSSFLHQVCANKEVTLEIVKHLLDFYPQAINTCFNGDDIIFIHYVESAYPLHLACYNNDCPNEVIDLLLRNIPGHQLTRICRVHEDWGGYCDDNGGTPLHYYLSRTNVDLDIVKRLMANTDALLLADEESKCTPIHILLHNTSIGDMFDVLQYLVELNPSSLRKKDKYGENPLHCACRNQRITVETIKLLLNVGADVVYEQNECGEMPLHCLCSGSFDSREKKLDDEVAIDILKLLLAAHPDWTSIQTDEVKDDGSLPLHKAAGKKSQAFCKLLVDAYPEAVEEVDGRGLPLHHACEDGRLETVEYLFGLYPESLNIRDDWGRLPIHCTARRLGNTVENAAEIIKFLLRHDPECLSKPVVFTNQYGIHNNGDLPLHIVCSFSNKDNSTELLYDLYPEAILIRNERRQLPIDIVREKLDSLTVNPETGIGYNEERYQRLQDLIPFLYAQMSHATKAQNESAMRRRDFMGLLPLHQAIRSRAPLGSIKLLVKGYPNAVNVPDGSRMHPLDIAIQYSKVDVVKYLAELSDEDCLNVCDVNKNYPLHRACRSGNCEVIAYLLERPKSLVSERNVDDKLPIHLFCEFVRGRWCEGETPEYTETIWRLLTAYPETVLNW